MMSQYKLCITALQYRNQLMFLYLHWRDVKEDRRTVTHVLCVLTELNMEYNPSDHPRASTIFLSKSQNDGERLRSTQCDRFITLKIDTFGPVRQACFTQNTVDIVFTHDPNFFHGQIQTDANKSSDLRAVYLWCLIKFATALRAVTEEILTQYKLCDAELDGKKKKMHLINAFSCKIESVASCRC